MKALVYTGPHTMALQDVDEPRPSGADDVLLRI